MNRLNQRVLQNRERILDFERKSSDTRETSNQNGLKSAADSLLGQGAEAVK